MSKILPIKKYSDLLGALASGTCMIHCMATPFIFLAQSQALSCGMLGPWWWHLIDYIFLIISLIAITKSHQATSISWIPIAMYLSWGLLALMIINHKLLAFPIPDLIIYIPASALIGLHLYQHRYCKVHQCNCCST